MIERVAEMIHSSLTRQVEIPNARYRALKCTAKITAPLRGSTAGLRIDAQSANKMMNATVPQ
jgi:hypothetical protein